MSQRKQVLFSICFAIVALVLLPVATANGEGLNLLGERNCEREDQKVCAVLFFIIL